MREYSITTSPVSFLTIQELRMEQEINQHGRMWITGYIADEDEEVYLKLLSGEVWEKVEGVDAQGDREILFWGIVTDFSIVSANDQRKMTLEITTGSCIMDDKKHLRSYQDRNSTYEQILRDRVKEYADGGIIFNSSCAEAIEDLVLQYHETDWEFMKRMASRKNGFLVPEAGVKGSKIFYDLPKGKEFTFPKTGTYAVGKNLEEFRIRRNELPWLSEADCLVYMLTDRESHRMGDYALIHGRTFYVYKVESSYEGGELMHRCYMKQKKGLQIPVLYQSEMVGCSLDAKVKAVKENKVQVTITGDENTKQEIDVWYPYATVYSTPDGTGWYCMPEMGDEVRLTVPGREEGQAFVTSSVHVEIDSADRKNPDDKVLKSKYRKEVRFTPDSIVITNNQGTKIEMTDAEGIHIVSAHSVMLEAAEDLMISSDTGSLIVAGTSSVNLQQRGTSISLDNGISFIGGELKVQ